MPFTPPLSVDPHKDAGLLPSVSARVQGRLNSNVYPGELILGIENVDTLQVLVEEWGEERFEDVDADHYPGTLINEVRFSKSATLFDLGFWALDATETAERLELEGGSASRGARINRVRYAGFAAVFVRRGQEKRRSALLRDPANYGANTSDLTGSEWGPLGDRILSDVIAAVDAIHAGTGADDNEMSLFLPRDVWREARLDTGFVAFRKSGGKLEASGIGTIEEMSQYLQINTWTDGRGLEVALTRGAAPTKLWGNDALLYVDHARIPGADEWGIPTFGRVYRNQNLGAKTAWIDRHHDVWHFPWKARERSFLQKAAAGFLFEDAVAP